MIEVCVLRNVKWKSCIEYLEEHEIMFRRRNLRDYPWTFEEFQSLLEVSVDGLEEIVSTKSEAYKELEAQGIQFEALSLYEAYKLIVSTPSLLKLPITTDYKTRVGTGQNGAIVFMPRGKKLISFTHNRLKAAELDKEARKHVLSE